MATLQPQYSMATAPQFVGRDFGASDWVACFLIIVVATIGKFGGTYAAARIAGLARRKAAALGILMNTRGLMELIVLNVGLDLHVISPRMFAMMVLMALVTTVATAPLLRWLVPVGSADDEPAARLTAGGIVEPQEAPRSAAS